MGLLHWLDHWLASLERALVVLLLSGLLGLGLLQVIERNVLASGIFWADELLQHMASSAPRWPRASIVTSVSTS